MPIRIPILAGLLAALLGAMAGHAQTASLVADLVTSEGRAAGSDPEKLTAVRGGRIVFEAGEDSVGRELWASDGTAEGTVLLADICPGRCDANLTFHGTFDGVALLSDYVFGQVWHTDGTREGTFPLRDPSRGGGPLENVYGNTAVFGGFVYFQGCGQVQGCGLWRTDGTPAGTQLLARQSRLSGELILFAMTDRALFFSLYRPDFTAFLWRTDGTAAGTVRLAEFRGDLPRSLTPVGSKLFFTASDGDGQELWVSDGTRAGTRPVTSFRPPLPFGGGFSVSAGEPLLFADGNRVDFAVHDGFHGWEVWQSDGTPEGTRPITDFAYWYPYLSQTPVPLATVGGRLLIPVLSSDNHWSLWASNGRSMVRLHNCLGGCGINFTGPPRLVVQGDQVLFTSGAGLGQELWSTDGTRAGTRKLLSACTETCRSVIGLTSAKLGGLAVFRITDRGKDQLWATDGTAAGTRALFHLPPGTSAGALPVAAGSKTFFGAANEKGMELWVSEGGEERLVANVASEAVGSYPTTLVALGSRLVFQAGPHDPLDTANSTRALWQSEGTEAATSRLLDLFRQPVDCHFLDCLPPMAAAESWLALVNTPRDEVNELWRTDGTAEGAVRLLTVQAPGRIQHLGAFQDTVVFFIESPHHLEIWRSDGTVAGTFQIAHKAGRLRVYGAGGTGTEVYFEIATASTFDLWRSDGTPEGTVPVARLPEGPGLDTNLAERLPIRIGDRVFFSVYVRSTEEMWTTDGTEEGTVRLMEAEDFPRQRMVIDDSLYFLALEEFGYGLWRSDGTEAGTVLLHRWGSIPSEMIVFDGKLFFAAGGDFAAELWSSDGTPAGTGPVVDLNPDGGSDPNSFAVFGDYLYFSAYDPEHGYELWQSDGTAGGTRLFQDIAPGILSSSPDRLTVAGDRLYFTAADRATGRELWSLH
ncbi:MAG TPA: ELWxxDGT repeat protein [Thermoanaerobaculia bacterium]|nr:ELWxxDGT repeat protein [Thermoanaerobaculia bacterium]